MMPADLLADIVRQIDQRKRELAAAVHEYERLEAARAALDGTPGSTRNRSAAGRRGTATASRRGGDRRPSSRALPAPAPPARRGRCRRAATRRRSQGIFAAWPLSAGTRAA